VAGIRNLGVYEKIEFLKKFYTGTTTVGIRSIDGIVLATDRRVTSGFYIAHKHGKKIHKIDSHVAATIAGAVADAQNMVETLKAESALYKLEVGRPIRIRSLATLASTILFNSRPNIYIVQMIIGGIDDEGPQIYTVDWFGTVTREDKYIATGSGTPMALAVLESLYRENLGIEDTVSLAVKAVKAAMRLDPGSGEGIDVVVIDKKGYRELSFSER